MKKIILVLLSLFSYTTFISQTTFEKGYFINNDDEKIECLIEILDLFYTPTTFNYKLSEDGKKRKTTIKEVKQFEIYDVVKYERHIVDMDRSSEIIDNLSNVRKAIFNKDMLETLKTKVLSEIKEGKTEDEVATNTSITKTYDDLDYGCCFISSERFRKTVYQSLK